MANSKSGGASRVKLDRTLISPSRWWRQKNCPASIRLENECEFPEESSAAAERGTALHEQVHQGAADTDSEAKSAELVAAAKAFSERLRSHDGILAWTPIIGSFSEERMSAVIWFDDLLRVHVSGQPDLVLRRRSGATIVDFKFAREATQDLVSAGAAQLELYAWLVLEHLKIDLHDRRPFEFELILWVSGDVAWRRIFVPTLEWRVSVKDSILFAFDRATFAAPIPGPWCRYCPALGFCDATRRDLLELPRHLPDLAKVDHGELLVRLRTAEAAVKRLRAALKVHVALHGSETVEVVRRAGRRELREGWQVNTLEDLPMGIVPYLRPEDLEAARSLSLAKLEDAFVAGYTRIVDGALVQEAKDVFAREMAPYIERGKEVDVLQMKEARDGCR